MSVEPSMEEILSSIKRIIAEEEAPTGRRRAAARPLAPAPTPASPSLVDEEDEDEVLELSDPMPAYPQRIPVPSPASIVAAPPEDSTADPMPAPNPSEARAPSREPSTPPAAPTISAPAASDAPPAGPILSSAAVDATRGALDSLSRLLVKPEPQSDGTLEGLVRDMLRPMLKEWLDAHLPDMVEAMVSREIARISGQAR